MSMTPLTSSCSCGCHHDESVADVPTTWLTPEELVEHLRGAVTVGTLRNYRAARIGPRYLKVGRSIFYTLDNVNDWLAELAAADELRWNDRC